MNCEKLENDVDVRKISHDAGFEITFEGEPATDHFIGHPAKYPRDLTPLQITRLIREGFDAFRAAWKARHAQTAVLVLKSK